MSWQSKVVWSEGMLLQPQHLQQHDRYLHSIIETRVAGTQAYSWGYASVVVDEALLGLGKKSIHELSRDDLIVPENFTRVSKL